MAQSVHNMLTSSGPAGAATEAASIKDAQAITDKYFDDVKAFFFKRQEQTMGFVADMRKHSDTVITSLAGGIATAFLTRLAEK